MALINKVENVASVDYEGDIISSLSAQTLLLLSPMLEKTVDEAQASIGDILTYTVVITNPGAVAITNLPFSDPIPAGTTYEEDSFELNGVQVTPTIVADVLTYTIPNIDGEDEATITFQVMVAGGVI